MAHFISVSPRFGAVATDFDGFTFITGGLLTAPLVYPPYPDSYDNVYCDVSVFDPRKLILRYNGQLTEVLQSMEISLTRLSAK